MYSEFYIHLTALEELFIGQQEQLNLAKSHNYNGYLSNLDLVSSTKFKSFGAKSYSFLTTRNKTQNKDLWVLILPAS